MAISRAGGVRRVTPQRRCQWGGSFGSRSFPLSPRMFNFSANHLFLLSRTEYPTCAVFLMQDLDTQRVYRLYDFTKALLIRPGRGLLRSGQGQQRR